jgi:hypothetical protein
LHGRLALSGLFVRPLKGLDMSKTAPETAPAAPPAEEQDDDLFVLDAGWEHQRLSFAGDELAVRTPTTQALTGYSLASSKYVPNDTRNDMTSLFIISHLGPESYGRVISRMMDGDDSEYTVDTVGLLMREIVLLKTAVDG